MRFQHEQVKLLLSCLLQICHASNVLRLHILYLVQQILNIVLQYTYGSFPCYSSKHFSYTDWLQTWVLIKRHQSTSNICFRWCCIVLKLGFIDTNMFNEITNDLAEIECATTQILSMLTFFSAHQHLILLDLIHLWFLSLLFPLILHLYRQNNKMNYR